MPGRHTISTDYRYGYNGMEMDNEMSGNGNSYTTEFRQYDPRLMRWKSLDPLMHQFPHMSPYVAFDNNPIYFTDVYGLESDGPGDEDCDGEPEKPINETLGSNISGYDFQVFGSKTGSLNGTGYSSIPPKSKDRLSVTANVNGTIISGTGNGISYNTANFYENIAFDQYWNAQNNGTMTSQMYSENNWGRFDPNNAYGYGPRATYNGANAKNDWMLEVETFNKLGVALNYGMLGLAGGVLIEAAVASSPLWTPYLPQIASFVGKGNMINGSINALMNFTGQTLGTGGDLNQVDRASVAISFGSAFVPGNEYGVAVGAGIIDGLYDYSSSGSSRLGNGKTILRTISDASFSTLGNVGATSFGKLPFYFMIPAHATTTIPTTVGNSAVNTLIVE